MENAVGSFDGRDLEYGEQCNREEAKEEKQTVDRCRREEEGLGQSEK
jgi:hypothetical protein